MRRNYLDVLNEIKRIALAHPQVKSVDEGRELEFDVNKKDQFVRIFIRTDAAGILGGLGSAEPFLTLSILFMDRLNSKRTNTVDVLSQTHMIALGFLATLNKEKIIRMNENPTLNPLYDYQDTQTAGWIATVRVYLETAIECYPI